MKKYFPIIFILLIWITKVQIIKSFTAEILCGRIPDLTPAQRKVCVSMPDATVALSTGHQLGAEECQHQFQGYRWNCSHVWRPNYFNHVIDIGTREAAFTYAITNAGAVHTIAHACARGNISRCGCDHPERNSNNYRNIGGMGMNGGSISSSSSSSISSSSGNSFSYKEQQQQLQQQQQHYNSRFNTLSSSSSVSSSSSNNNQQQQQHKKRHQHNKHQEKQNKLNEQDPNQLLDSDQAWKWGGCSHDVNFGMKFAKKFFDAREIENDARSLMNLHNNRVGRKIVKNHLRTECKCHGVSGSCAVKTCWKSLPPFRVIGDALMKKYKKARMVKAIEDKKTKELTLVIHRKEQFRVGLPPKRMDLVYIESSPNYCERNLIKGSFGTFGRKCNRTLKDVGSCDLLCCGRGYDTKQIFTQNKCRCKFVWCCSVHCDICSEYHEENVCK